MAIIMKTTKGRSIKGPSSSLSHSRPPSSSSASLQRRYPSSSFSTNTLHRDPFLLPSVSSQQRFISHSQQRSLSSSLQRSVSSSPTILSKSAPQVGALEALLSNPLRFVPATSLTFEDETKMVAVLRPRKVARKNETAIQRQQRLLHQHIPPNWGRQRGAGLRTQGMPNWNRVLCYRHSGLQAFLHVPKFVNWLEQEHMAADCAIDNCLACALRDLCEVYWLENPPPAISQKTAIRKALERIDKLAHLLRWYDEDRRPNQHQDAEEYFRWILTTIADQLPPVASSTLSSLFIIHVDSTIKCRQRKCNHHSTTPDTQLNLQTNIPPPPTNKKQAPRLTDYITSSLHETITDLRCSSCSNTATKPRIYTLTSAPPILILQQKRFSINPQNGTTSKLTHRVTFSEWLDLTSHSPSSSTSPREQILYRLTSVVSHAGSLTHGHYKTVAKGPDHKWSEINDDFVRGKVGFKEVVEPGKWGKMDWTPYLLFYERVESVVVDG